MADFTADSKFVTAFDLRLTHRTQMCVRFLLFWSPPLRLARRGHTAAKNDLTASATRCPMAAQAVLSTPTDGHSNALADELALHLVKYCFLYCHPFPSWPTTIHQVDQWDFDPFELEEVTQGHPLVALSTYLFTVKYNLFACFPFSKVRATRFQPFYSIISAQ